MKNLNVRFQIVFYFSGNQIVAMLPDKYQAYHYLATSYFLDNDVSKLCQNLAIYFEMRSKYDRKLLNSDNIIKYMLLYLESIEGYFVYVQGIATILEKSYPDTAIAYFFKAIDFYDNKQDGERAISCFLEAIAIDNNFVFANFYIALIYSDIKNWKAAIPYFSKCIVHDLNDAEIYFEIAQCYSKIKDFENEIASYHKCLEIDPEYPITNHLGYAYQNSKNYSQALSFYQQAIKLAHDGEYPYRNYFRLLKKLRLGQYENAIEFYEDNKQKFPESISNKIEQLQQNNKNNHKRQVTPINDINDELIEITKLDTECTTMFPHKRQINIIKNSFTSEAHLEIEIERQMNKGIPLFGGLPLRVYTGQDNKYGRQYIIPIPKLGIIDILAVNEETGDFYIIELKKEIGDDDVIGQISRYMGWVSENLALNGQKVYGIICAGDFSEKLKYAAKASESIKLFKYDIQISLIE